MSTGAKWGAVSVVLIGVVLGIFLWGGFNWAMEMTNDEEFCISCHEMEENVYEELQETIHFANRTGVRATCPDCHVPKEWVYKVKRKIQATNELYHKFMGSIDTPEKFEAKRFELAKNVWKAMKDTDSRECRNCHAFESMDFDKQEGRAVERHEEMEEAAYDEPGEEHAQAAKAGLTCIDCHKGIAHSLPAEYDAEKDIIGASPYYE
jgi:cytochrome c-type protein NapC